ncbi:PREDICTED: hemK methyltransferase family member 1 [Polistes dominula]|uniref:peptide chain release factor N(5)-glutamine methyltransferase n=1 Tax=Polistes dominula TaxID=743375 RepID=A0ABM1HXN8_POLDO|nr:PREDICTED: hemK methyltransferase family member 1 [Polistes dominula]
MPFRFLPIDNVLTYHSIRTPRRVNSLQDNMLYRRILKTCVLVIEKNTAMSITRTRNNVTMNRAFTSNCSTNCPTIREIVEKWSHRFENEAIPEPVESIEHIVAHVVGLKKLLDVTNFRDKRLTEDQLKELESLCECRLSRMPVQYIIGEWDFRDITLKLVPPVFIPRPETEIIVDIILKRLSYLQEAHHEILEIGCGSGAISLALAHSSDKVKCIAVDNNPHACDLTKENCSKLGLRERVTVMQATLEEDGTLTLSGNTTNLRDQSFAFIVSNPPYVPTKDILKLEPEIKIYEDLRALDGGIDGLKIIKPLIQYSAKALKPGGRLFIEVDPVHPEYISFFVKKYDTLKLHYEHTYKDFCNNDRFVEISKIL